MQGQGPRILPVIYIMGGSVFISWLVCLHCEIAKRKGFALAITSANSYTITWLGLAKNIEEHGGEGEEEVDILKYGITPQNFFKRTLQDARLSFGGVGGMAWIQF